MENTVYVQTDSAGRITAIESDARLHDTAGWIEIDTGSGDAYQHAQSNYLPTPLTDEQGRYRYKLVNGVPAMRTEAELQEDGVQTGSDPLATLQAKTTLLTAQLQAVADRGEFIEDCIAEMADTLYGDV